MENLSDLMTEKDSKNRLNNWVAVSVAILAAFMAVTKVKDDNIVQAMLQAQAAAVDTWSEYQSTRLKQHMMELGKDQAQSVRLTAQAQATAQLDEQVKHYDSEISRYNQESDDLRNKAHGFEAQYDALNYRDDQFDLSDAALSVGLAMLAVTALTGKRWLLWASLVFAGIGLIMGLAGLFGLHLHPDSLTKLLS
jgi:hypothetical protein